MSIARTASEPSTHPLTGVLGRGVAPVLTGFLLIVAGLAKTHKTVMDLPDGSDGLLPSWLLIALAQIEVVLGVWLVSGLYPRTAKSVAITCFAAFCGVSLYQVLSGEPSCGCFGRVSVNPRYVLLLDFFVVVVLWASPWEAPTGGATRSNRKRVVVFGVAVAALGAIQGAVYLHAEGAGLQGGATKSGRPIVLRPETWVGQKLPVLDQLDIGRELTSGHRVVLLDHDNCPHCDEALARFGELARTQKGLQFASVYVPSSEQAGPRTAGEVPYRTGYLEAGPEWLVRTPIHFRLKNGVVTATAQGADELVARDRSAPVDANSPRGAAFPDYERAFREQFLREIACGPLALLAVFETLGVPIGQEERERIIAAAGARGTDMLQLKELAESHGLYAVGTRVSAEELKKLGLPAIVHLNAATFAAVTGYSADGYRVVYPLQSPKVITGERLEATFGQPGSALLLSRRPLSLRSLGLAEPAPKMPAHRGPSVFLERSSLAVGRIVTHHWAATLTLTNDGDAPLEIQEAVPSCTCMTARLDQSTVPPGGSTTLRVEGRQASPGGFTYQIAVATNQAGGSVVRVPVRGYLAPAVLFPTPSVVLGSVIQGREEVADVPIRLTEAIDLQKLDVVIPAGAPLALDFTGPTAARLRWKGSGTPGWYRYELGVRCRDIPDNATATLHVAAQVVPWVEAVPPSVLIRRSEVGQGWSRRCVLRLNDRVDGPLSEETHWWDALRPVCQSAHLWV